MSNGKRNFQKSKGENPALKRAITEHHIRTALIDARKGGIEWACLAYEVITLMVLHDKFNITDKDELKRYCNEMGSLSDCISKDYATLSDFIKTLHDECNFTLSEDELAAIDPGLCGLLKDQNS